MGLLNDIFQQGQLQFILLNYFQVADNLQNLSIIVCMRQ